MHILFVNDDPVASDVLGMNPQEVGHLPDIAHNIQVSLAELRHNGINAVLLDIILHDGDWRG